MKGPAVQIDVLDHGHVRFIEAWGSDERIIEAARMSTSKGFQGWGPKHRTECSTQNQHPGGFAGCDCPCDASGDEKLLEYLYNHKHATPFEMAGMVLEVKAPIFVFREWHRHRTQSYNEMSARYIPLPDENYVPTVHRILSGSAPTGNRQAAGTVEAAAPSVLQGWTERLSKAYALAQAVYEEGLSLGVPKELARLPVPVARYSRMRASANLRNWISFLTLRMASNAQREIRDYANAVSTLVAEHFPRTHALFVKEQAHG